MKATSNKAWPIFFQPHLGKSGVRAKNVLIYLGVIYYLFWGSG
jgi:hypothetical protein